MFICEMIQTFRSTLRDERRDLPEENDRTDHCKCRSAESKFAGEEMAENSDYCRERRVTLSANSALKMTKEPTQARSRRARCSVVRGRNVSRSGGTGLPFSTAPVGINVRSGKGSKSCPNRWFIDYRRRRQAVCCRESGPLL